MDLRLHPCSVAPAEGPEKCGPNRPTPTPAGFSCNNAAHNERGKPFTWVKTADEILDKMRRFGLRVQQIHGR